MRLRSDFHLKPKTMDSVGLAVVLSREHFVLIKDVHGTYKRGPADRVVRHRGDEPEHSRHQHLKHTAMAQKTPNVLVVVKGRSMMWWSFPTPRYPGRTHCYSYNGTKFEIPTYRTDGVFCLDFLQISTEIPFVQ